MTRMHKNKMVNDIYSFGSLHNLKFTQFSRTDLGDWLNTEGKQGCQ